MERRGEGERTVGEGCASACASIEFFDLEFGEMTRLGLVIHGGALYNCPGS